MKENKLSGFSPVFRYTLKRNLTSRKFLISTVLIGVLLLLGIAVLVFVFGKPDNDKKGLQVGTLKVCDETGLGVPDYKEMAKARKETEMEKVFFEEVKDSKTAVRDGAGKKDFLLAVQIETEGGYQVKLVSGKEAEFEESDLEYLGKQLSMDFQSYIYQKAGLSEEALREALVPVVYGVSDFTEDGKNKEALIYSVVYAVMLTIYMMVIFYGMQICSEVSQEKITKLVEQLLVSVTPYGLVSGKILAVILTSILQFAGWILCVFAGVFAGDFLCGTFYEGYESSITMVLSMIKSVLDGYDMEPAAIVLGIGLMIFGLIFYLVIAGVAGSMINRPDEAGSMQTLFMAPVVISFFFILYLLGNGVSGIGVIWYILPFTGAMLTPGAVLVGTVSIPFGLLCMAVCILGSGLLLWFAAKAYKALLFYSGNKLTLGKALRMVWKK